MTPNDSQVRIVLGVDLSQAPKLSEFAGKVEASVARELQAYQKKLAVLDELQGRTREYQAQAQDYYAAQGDAARAALVFLEREVQERTAAIASAREHAAAVKNAATENARSAELMRQRNAQLFAEEQAAARQRDQLHTQGILEDRRRLAQQTADEEAALKRRTQQQTQAILEDRQRGRDAMRASEQVQAGINGELAQMRERNALIRTTSELERVEARIRLGNYEKYNAAQLQLLRNLAKEHDMLQRRQGSLVQTAGNFATGALSFAGVGFGANALGGGIAAAAGLYKASQISTEFERAEQAVYSVNNSMAETQAQMRRVSREAERLGISVTDLARLWARFEAASKGTTLEGEKARNVFMAVAEAAQKLSLRGDEVEGVLRAIEQMMSKGKIQAEELRGQLGDRLPGAFNIMARAMGVSTAELDKMLKSGQVMSDEVLPKFAAELRRTFGTDASSRIQTNVADFQRLTNEVKLTADAIGDGLNPVLAFMARQAKDGLGWLRQYFQEFGAWGAAGGAPGVVVRSLLRDDPFVDAAAIARNPGALAAAAYQPAGTAGSFYGPGKPSAQQVGAPLDLTEGVAELDDKRYQKLKEEVALFGEKSEYAKAIWFYTEGEGKAHNYNEKMLALELARMKDKAAAAKDLVKADKADDKDFAYKLKLHTDELFKQDSEQVEILRKSREEREKWAKQLREAIRTPDEVRNDNIARLDAAYADGSVNADQRTAALQRFNDQYYESLDKLDQGAKKTFNALTVYSEQAARGMQSALADFFFDPFNASLGDMLGNFATTLQRMAAEAAAAELLKSLGGWGNANAGASGLMGLLAGGASMLFGPGAQSGGGGSYQGLFDSGYSGGYSFSGDYATGGKIGGKGTSTSDSNLIRVSRGEYVVKAASVNRFGTNFFDHLNAGRMPKYATGGMIGDDIGSSGRTIVNIENHSGQPAKAERSRAGNGDEIINIVIGEMVRSINSNGPVGQAISKTYGLPRRPVMR